MNRNEQGWIDAYKKKGALWIHDGNPRRPHVILRSGKHSNGYFDSRPLIEDRWLMQEAASDLVDLVSRTTGRGVLLEVDVVVGPQTGATLLSGYIAQEITSFRGRQCRWASPKRSIDEKRMIFDDPERTVWPGDRVLLCDDVVSTGGSTNLVGEAVAELGGVILPFSMLVLVNRSGHEKLGEKVLTALITRHLSMWEPDACQLHPESEGIENPKEPENWTRLNADY